MNILNGVMGISAPLEEENEVENDVENEVVRRPVAIAHAAHYEAFRVKNSK